MNHSKQVARLLTLLLLVAYVHAGDNLEDKIPAGAKVYIAPIADGFDQHLRAALRKKKVPVVLVESREEADYEITGHSETQKAGKAKKIIMWDWRSNEQASIKLENLKTGVIVFAYSVNKKSSAHGKRSTAEACAKHMKKYIAQPKQKAIRPEPKEPATSAKN